MQIFCIRLNSTLVTKKNPCALQYRRGKKMRKKYTTEEKQNLVAMFKKGTQTTTAFAQANGINPVTFRSWLYVKRRQVVKPETTGFVEIKTPARVAEKNIKIQKDGIEILLPVNTEFHELQNILQAVHSL